MSSLSFNSCNFDFVDNVGNTVVIDTFVVVVVKSILMDRLVAMKIQVVEGIEGTIVQFEEVLN